MLFWHWLTRSRPAKRAVKWTVFIVVLAFRKHNNNTKEKLHSVAAEQQDLSMNCDNYLMREKLCM